MSTQIGNAGEYYVMSYLLWRRCHVGLADRGNPVFDLLLRTPTRDFRAIRIKTSSADDFKWTAKGELDPLPGFDKDNPDPTDMAVLVAFNREMPGVKTEMYVMPTAQLVNDINRVHIHYNKFKNRDGSDRKLSRMRVIRLSGKARPENIAYGFREDWKSYRDAWHLLGIT
jgi:hypothetical protein